MNRFGNLSVFILVLFLKGTLVPQSAYDVLQTKTQREEFPTYSNINLYPQNDSILTVLGQWAWGSCLSVDTDSAFAYIANGSSFQIIDISKPSLPRITGDYNTGYIYQLRVRENTAFVCNGRGLIILDISKPTAPQKLSFIEIPGFSTNFALSDSFAYVSTLSGFLMEIDISDLRNPYIRGSKIKFSEISTCIEAKNRFVYIGSFQYPLTQIVDATNPDSMVNYIFDFGGTLTSACVRDSLLYAGVCYVQNYLKIYNISNQLRPQLIGQTVISDSVLIDAVTISQNGLMAYTLNAWAPYPTLNEEGIYSIDISDLTQPLVKDKFIKETQVGANGLAISRNTLVAAYYSGVIILDASEPDTLIFNSFFVTGGTSQKIKLKYPYTFLASGFSGVWIIDITEPKNPKSVSNIQTGGFISDIVVEDSLIYAIDWAKYAEEDTSRGLWIISINDINKPRILSHYTGITHHESIQIVPNTISKSGDAIYLTQGPSINDSSILEIIDVSNPLHPIRAGIFHSNTSPYGVAINDTIAYLATDNGLKIINVSNPEIPLEISTILSITRGVTYKYPYVYTASSIFNIIDAEDPYNPFVVSSINTQHNSFGIIDLVIDKDYAYWAENYLGVIDISEPRNPVQIDKYSELDAAGITFNEDRLYCSDPLAGLWILKNNKITSVVNNKKLDDNPFFYLFQNYPNPFNSVTSIGYLLKEDGFVSLKVYDILGSEVANLVSQEQKSGHHTIDFNASNLSSGVYFYSIRMINFTTTLKMLFIK